jgi:hypothetical protein
MRILKSKNTNYLKIYRIIVRCFRIGKIADRENIQTRDLDAYPFYEGAVYVAG